MIRDCCLRAAGLMAVAACILGAAPQTPRKFEAATVKLNKSEKDWPGMHSDPSRLVATNMTLKSMVAMAYLVREDQVSGGPGWLDSERYDIVATSERVTNEDAQRQMLRTLLTERFKLRIRQLTKDAPGFDLVVAKNGPKLHAAKEDAPSRRRFGKGRLALENGTMENLARLLAGVLGRPVADRTGIKGGYDVSLLYTPEGFQAMPADDPRAAHEPPQPDPNGPSLFIALQEQLGLKLESRKGTAEFLVVDHAEKPGEN
jgi:uncharacterized protein (TIGR03435 family)